MYTAIIIEDEYPARLSQEQMLVIDDKVCPDVITSDSYTQDVKDALGL